MRCSERFPRMAVARASGHREGLQQRCLWIKWATVTDPRSSRNWLSNQCMHLYVPLCMPSTKAFLSTKFSHGAEAIWTQKTGLKRLLQLKQNNPKQFQNKTKTICFGLVSALRTCETKRWNKTKVGVAYLSIKVYFAQQHCYLVNFTALCSY